MFEMGELGIGLLGLGGTLVSGFTSWFFTRKSYEAEVKNKEVNNFDAALDAYKKMYEDMINDLKDQNADLRGQKEDLKKEIETLKSELSENRKQIITLTNFVLASALQRADGNIPSETVETLKDIIK